MAKKIWFVCIAENVLGPLDAKTVTLMVEQNRLRVHDYLWREGFKKWMPMYAIGEFAPLLAPYPAVAPPSAQAPKAPPASSAPAPAAPAPARATAPIPIRQSDRTEVSGKVKIAGAGEFAIINMSTSGIFIACTHPLKVGSEVSFEAHLNGLKKPLGMTGLVVRQGMSPTNVPGYAFEFVRPNPGHLRTIKEFIESMKTAKAG